MWLKVTLTECHPIKRKLEQRWGNNFFRSLHCYAHPHCASVCAHDEEEILLPKICHCRLKCYRVLLPVPMTTKRCCMSCPLHVCHSDVNLIRHMGLFLYWYPGGPQSIWWVPLLPLLLPTSRVRSLLSSGSLPPPLSFSCMRQLLPVNMNNLGR